MFGTLNFGSIVHEAFLEKTPLTRLDVLVMASNVAGLLIAFLATYLNWSMDMLWRAIFTIDYALLKKSGLLDEETEKRIDASVFGDLINQSERDKKQGTK